MRSESFSMATFGQHMYQIHLLGECGALNGSLGVNMFTCHLSQAIG
jgi:hypothetical protein